MQLKLSAIPLSRPGFIAMSLATICLSANSEPLPPLDELPVPPVEPVDDAAAPVPAAELSDNVTVNLINRLVKRGLLTEEDARDLLTLAEADARRARAKEEAMLTMIEDAAAPPIEEGDISVAYIPEPVKAQMRADITAELLAQTSSAKWNTDRTSPEWTRKFEFFGDIRGRYEGRFYPSGNDNTGAFPDFNAINTGPPFDVAGTQFSPQHNVDKDRHRTNLRARLGTDITLEEGFSAGMRIATGSDSSPVTTNQTLGGSGGNFSKYQLWLDRAFIRWEHEQLDEWSLGIDVGRFENPLFASDVLWDDDIGMDGIALRSRFEMRDDVQGFLTAGVFPIFNTSLNFSSNRPDKFSSTDKWLYAAQFGVDWKIRDELSARFAVLYQDFDGVQGKKSTPFVPLTSQDAGDTDSTRPSFAQRGNTYFPLRDILPDPSNNFGATNQWQYFGLASPFRTLTVNGRLDYDGWQPFRMSLMAEATKNLAYERPPTAVTDFGGDMAYYINLRAGHAALDQRGNWMAWLGYRHVETDAVVDAFTDSDFGGGGTNVKGFTLGASYALAPSVWLSSRWMSSDEVDGPPLKNDTIQFDINARF